jgi:heme oxygenase
MSNDIHQRLRAATAADHQRLEARLAVQERVADAAARAGLVVRYWRFHARAEAALAPWLGGMQGLDFEARLRTPLLRRDLADLGLEPPDDGDEGPAVESLGAALGVMYVLEGSALGGRVIRRELAQRGQDFVGLGFLDPYGPETGRRWRSFLEVLAREAREMGQARAVVGGARAGFRHAEQVLCEGRSDV